VGEVVSTPVASQVFPYSPKVLPVLAPTPLSPVDVGLDKVMVCSFRDGLPL
jgi:hypothetical protein